MPEAFDPRAEADFNRARIYARLANLVGMAKPSIRELMPFEEAKRILKPKSESYRGLVTVPLDHIVGSEGRYRDFTRFFFPKKEHLKTRWTSIDSLHYRDIILPPVLLYEMGGIYFVRDGNHRVSVARTLGQQYIDAEVISLQSEISLSPDMTVEDIKRAVISYEKNNFYKETNYPHVTGADDLDFSEPGRYDTIREHVYVHKYFLNQHRTEEIPFYQALYSWHENVYLPICDAIDAENLLSLFPGRTTSDLYLYLVAHWDELKRRYGQPVDIGEAAESFRQLVRMKHGGAWKTLLCFFKKIYEKIENFPTKR
ncbi:MAG: transcriptional regulator [Rectinema sp.]|nr:transcriptional regulator [Rectinema sp.]